MCNKRSRGAASLASVRLESFWLRTPRISVRSRYRSRVCARARARADEEEYITGEWEKGREGAERPSFSFSKAHGESRVLMHTGRPTKGLKGPRGSIVCASADESERLTSRPRNFSFHGAGRDARAREREMERDPPRKVFNRFASPSTRIRLGDSNSPSIPLAPLHHLPACMYLFLVTLLGHCCKRRGGESVSGIPAARVPRRRRQTHSPSRAESARGNANERRGLQSTTRAKRASLYFPINAIIDLHGHLSAISVDVAESSASRDARRRQTLTFGVRCSLRARRGREDRERKVARNVRGNNAF